MHAETIGVPLDQLAAERGTTPFDLMLDLALADDMATRFKVVLENDADDEIGALLADSPHTRPVPVQVSSSDPQLLRGVGSEPNDYKGSSGIVGVLQYTSAEAGIPTVSLWASAPHYVAQAPSPKVTLALLRSVEDVLDVSLPLGDLPEEARAWERGVDELAQQDSDVAEYVRTLEEAKDATDLPEASGDAIAREFERYLRRRGDTGDGDEF